MDETPDIRVLQALYQRYLQESVDLAEENAKMQVHLQQAQERLGEAQERLGEAEGGN